MNGTSRFYDQEHFFYLTAGSTSSDSSDGVDSRMRHSPITTPSTAVTVNNHVGSCTNSQNVDNGDVNDDDEDDR